MEVRKRGRESEKRRVKALIDEYFNHFNLFDVTESSRFV